LNSDDNESFLCLVFLLLTLAECVGGTQVLLSRPSPTPIPQCLSLNNTVSANVPDPTPIFVGGGGVPHRHEHSVMFMSSQYAYLIHVDPDSGAMDVQQAPIGSFRASAGVVGTYVPHRIPLILHVIPSGTSDLHFLAINNSVLYDYVPPWSLAQFVPSGFVPSASATRVMLGAHYVEDLFFASVDTVVRLCIDVQNPFRPFRHAVFNLSANFDNPLNVDQTTVIQVDRRSDRAYVLRSRSGSSPQDSGEVIVLKVSATHCLLEADNRVFVQPQPISLTVITAIYSSGADVYWPMSPDQQSSGGSDGRLYRWNLEDVHHDRTAVANLSLKLGPNDVIAPTGFTPIWPAQGAATFWGVVVSQTPGDTDVGATLVDADDARYGRRHRFEIVCQDKLPMALPTAAARTGNAAHSLVFASDSGQFTLVNVPFPKVSSSVDVEKRAAAAPELARGYCPAFSFGLPNTCSACTPPDALCGLTEHCASGCCFVSGGRVMCCSQSPPGTTTAGFSCANK
jgi:hypothetical protein